MRDEQVFHRNNLIGGGSNSPLATPYEMLIRQSRKLGATATNAWLRVKNTLEPLGVARRDFITAANMHRQEVVENIEKLRSMVKHSHEVIASIRTAFPFTIPPDTVVVDRTKITIIKRDFFWSSQVISIQVEDILNVTASVGPFFGSLNISSRVMNSVDHFTIIRLWRKDAVFLKHLIQGYVIAKHNNIDTTGLGTEELIDTLCELGSDSSG